MKDTLLTKLKDIRQISPVLLLGSYVDIFKSNYSMAK